ncbi:MAG TPA: c-type cytochrome [Saprospiraceae bacterium]|nr:c-type cytochrome [Saprospiraceae bacterium]
MHHNCLKYCLLLAFSWIFIVGRSYAEPTLEVGKALFQNQCRTCHNPNMKDDMTGPALAGFEERWADYPREDLYKWIHNSQALIAQGHPRAVELWNKWKPTVMTSFAAFTPDEIESIFLYINTPPVVFTPNNPNGPEVGGVDTSNDFIYWILFGVLLITVFTLSRAIINLRNIVAVSEGQKDPVDEMTMVKFLKNKTVMAFLIFALIVIGGYTTVNNGIAFGRQQGYKPEQPIKFSHEIHAGVQKIDCQYCHDSARRSKHASIPAANTCMNCHKAIEKEPLYGTQELTKIFASIGYDPATDKYIDNYDKLSNEEIKAIYTKWIGDSYMKDMNLTALDRRGIRTVNEQWEEIASSMTNELKSKISGPIEWTRIHMLPDHVYFNHAQHVNIGKIECQQCHGKVEEMDVLYQYSPLSMGWCVNCHRRTEVNFEGNKYYETYKSYHDALSKGEKTKITVEDIGGLECQKCHY